MLLQNIGFWLNVSLLLTASSVNKERNQTSIIDDRYYFSTKDWSAGCRHHNSYSVTLSLIQSL